MKGSCMRRVLVPTDFSAAAWLVTREAVAWVEALGGELLLLHVVPDIALRWLDHLALSFIDQTRLEAAYDDLRAEGQRQLARWRPDPALDRCRRLVVVGDTADAIVQVAQVEGVDVIRMPAPQRRWWRPRLVGSATEAVMRRASVPVVVWPGLEQMATRGWWRGARRPPAQDTRQEGAWHARRR